MKTTTKYETPYIKCFDIKSEQMFCQSQGSKEESLKGFGHDSLNEFEYIWK